MIYTAACGGAVHNPALALVEILGKLYNPDNTIAVPGFYDDVVALTAEERAMIAKTDPPKNNLGSQLGFPPSGVTPSTAFASEFQLAPHWTSMVYGAVGLGLGQKPLCRLRLEPSLVHALLAIRTRTKSTNT